MTVQKKILDLTGTQYLVQKITGEIPVKISDLQDDVTLGTHIADTDIHVTTADKTKWNNGVSQSYVLRYSSASVTDNSTIAYSTLDNTDNIKSGDKVIDVDGKIFSIVSVDTANSTFTVGSALIDLALDANVVHTSGNETISGNKTFSSNVNVYNSDSSTDTANIVLKNSKAERGSTTNIGEQNISFVDKNNNQLGNIKCINNSSRVTNMYITCNASGNDVGVRLSRSSSATYFRSTIDNDCRLGTADVRWADVQTYKVNALEPSSLSLPSGNVSDVIDISSYIIDLSGIVNTYIAPANGWISIAITGTSISIVSSPWSDSRSRPSEGTVRMLYPVLKGMTVNISVVCTTLAYARFIPCQGNV